MPIFRIATYLAGLVCFVAILYCQKNDDSNRLGSTVSNIRALKDTVGFSFTEAQIKAVVQMAEKLESQQLSQNKHIWGEKNWIAGICPHDDHLLAGRVYVHLMQNLTATRYVIFGVAHQAQKWGVQDKLIFDCFGYW